jgi:hypothetical protein
MIMDGIVLLKISEVKSDFWEKIYLGLLWKQLEVFRHSSGNTSLSTGFPRIMCDSMISSRSAIVTRPYHTASG